MSWEQFVVIDEFGDVLRLQHGSAKGHQAAAAWILTTEKLYGEGIFISGRAKVPGTSPDSHRAECFGIFGGLLLILLYVNKLNIDIVSINVCFWCDNKLALGYSFIHTQAIGANTPDFDVIGAMRDLLITSKLQPKWRYVKSHQSRPDLDIWACLHTN
jgi:hypothetical protein